jgi:2,5-diamino-6-(ribosylamino)-4(3H)-pyrimidinone 5'-phosphate reductase
VIINVASTLDGKIDSVARQGAAISSERDRERVDALRASVDAVMVGSRTLHQEDPRLTVKAPALRSERLNRGEPANPAKVGVASRVRLGADSRFVTSGPARVILLVARGGAGCLAQVAGVEVHELGEQGVDLGAAIRILGELGMRRVLVEGGGTLNAALLELDLVDEVQAYVAPVLFGGATAPTLADGPGLSHLTRLDRYDVEAWDDGGIVVRYRVRRR